MSFTIVLHLPSLNVIVCLDVLHNYTSNVSTHRVFLNLFIARSTIYIVLCYEQATSSLKKDFSRTATLVHTHTHTHTLLTVASEGCSFLPLAQ